MEFFKDKSGMQLASIAMCLISSVQLARLGLSYWQARRQSAA